MHSKNKIDTIIVGAGLSGLSCGVHLTDQDQRVLVLESRDVVGGRTSNWVQDGMRVESGLHRFLGFFEHLPSLIEHVGTEVDDIVFWEDEVIIKLPDNAPTAEFGVSPLHHPAHTIKGLLFNNDFLNPIEKAAVAKFFAAGFLELKDNPHELDSYTAYDYAKKHDLSEDVILRVIHPLTEGLFFLSPYKYSAYHFFALFAPYISKLHKTRAGAFMGGMTDVMCKPMGEYIVRHGGEVGINARVESLVFRDNRVVGVRVNGKEVLADNVVIATSLAEAQCLIYKHFTRHEWFQPMLSLPSMPAVTVQIELTQASLEKDRTTFSPNTCFSSYAEQSRTTFRHVPGRLSIILSQPEKFLRMNSEEILAHVLSDAKRLDLNFNEKSIKDFRVIRWPKDFYSYERRTFYRRPHQKTPVPGLTLAGDYTNQKYLSTMEGAVYSGKLAAELISLNTNNGSS